jgi:hypothetical protein
MLSAAVGDPKAVRYSDGQADVRPDFGRLFP